MSVGFILSLLIYFVNIELIVHYITCSFLVYYIKVMIMINFRAVGNRIKSYRADSNMTQETLAEQLSISVEYVSRIENGNCRASYSLIEKISRLFQVDESELLFGKKTGQTTDRELLERIAQLSTEQKEVVERLIRLLSEQKN